MCGIAGICSFNNIHSNDVELVKLFNSTMVRRGPDTDGLWTDNNNVVFGFRRLAIQDLNPRSNQPMLTDDAQHVLVYNGELYNASALRAELAHRVSFKTTSDTEVLLYALVHLGVDHVLARIDGIFAFAYYNVQKKELIIARDRPGTKPLYYGIDNNRLVFSSQYDHLLADPVMGGKSIDVDALAHYIDLGYVPEGEGIVQQTYLLPHGHYAKWNSEGLKVVPYYQYALSVRSHAEINIEEIIRQGIEDQLISDVPLGTFMSGGIDSTLVTYYARKKVAGLDTFNIGSVDPQYDESKFAEEYSKLFQTNHHARFFKEEDLRSLMADNALAYSEPFSDYSSLPTLLLSGFAKEKVTVTLSGDGGDELFWGYQRSEKAMRYVSKRLGGKAKLAYDFLINRLSGKKDFPLSLLQYKSMTEMFYSHLTVSGSQYWKPRIMKERISSKPYFFDASWKQEQGLNDVEGLMNVMRKLEFDLHLQRVLIKVDRASMFHSLEVRVPLLSNAMLDASTCFSFADCFGNGEGKKPLRKILANHAGERLAKLPKRGFVVPIDQWIRGSMKAEFQEKILDMPAPLRTHFKRDQLEQILHEHCDKNKDWSWMIWSLYSLSVWHSKFAIHQR
jgi:asparagine synthase (glutamine-hydrolysing)